jgi:hypothetical protein
LFKKLAELGHAITPSRNTQDIMHESLDELLLDILTRKIAFWEFARGEKFIEWNGLGSKWD